ncbi:MAG: SCO family protein [Campylobacter sp.]
MKKFLAVLIFVLVAGGGAFLAFKHYGGGFAAMNKYDFTAINEANATVSLKDFKGKYKVVYFGYLYCPDVCPTTLSLIENALKPLKRDDFELIFITLDPERDTPENLTLMAKNFYENATGLKLKNLKQVAANYGVKFQKVELKDSLMGYSVAHSSSIYLLDKDGNFFSEISNLLPENISANLQNLIEERP